MLPAEDPELAGVWLEMSATERLRFQLAEGEEPPPEVAERARQAFRDHTGQ